MPRARLGVAAAALAFLAVTVAAKRAPSARAATVTREIVAVYFGTEGTDAQSGMITAVRDMQTALRRQTAASGTRFVARGVSLEPTVEDGIRHLALFGSFDEISVGGNWTNSSVVHYFGGDMSDNRLASIPQVVILEREVRQDAPRSLLIGPEKEIGRYIGTDRISNWVKAGAPITR
jgi:hypothetical protein